jgi:hypothetical protein
MPVAIRVKLAIVAAVSALLAIILLTHVQWLNGPEYWKWPPRYVPALRWYPPMLLAAAPLLAAVAFSSKLKPWIAIALMMVSMLAMQVVAATMSQTPASFHGVIYTVESPTNLSYFTDAARTSDISTRELLSHYPHFMPQFSMHSQEKPPGPILFFRALLAIFGESDRTALIAGLLIGALATIAIPATYWLIGSLTDDPAGTARLFGAAFIALSPGLVLHLPQMDQLYPAFTCVLLATWYAALSRRSYSWAIAFGIVLALACFTVYHFLVLGAILAALTVAQARGRVAQILKLIAVALSGVAGFYALLLAATGFDPFATFVQALHCQADHLNDLYRPYPKTIVDDLADFALGAGWLGWLLIIFFLVRWRSHPARETWLVALCVAQLVLVATTGLLQTETARTWCFLLPLLAIGVGLELRDWSRWPRFAVIALMWLMLCLVGQNMKFIFKPSEQPQFTPPARSAP